MTQYNAKICIIGLGPAGLGAALSLANSSLGPHTICLEAGMSAEERVCRVLNGEQCCMNRPCQVISGIGGSSLLSGSKLSLFPAGKALSCGIGTAAETEVSLLSALALFRRFVPLTSRTSSPETIRQAESFYSKLGFEFRYYNAYMCRHGDLVTGYQSMLDLIRQSGVLVRPNTRALQVIRRHDGRFHVVCCSEGEESSIVTEKLVFATGRLGTQFLVNNSLPLGLELASGHLDIGVRLEFPTYLWPDIDDVHSDLKLHFGAARTFCVTKNGQIATYRYSGTSLLEGSSFPGASTGLTNLAITIRMPFAQPNEHLALFLDIQRRHIGESEGKPVRQKLTDYFEGDSLHDEIRGTTEAPASMAFWRWGDVSACYPPNIARAVRSAVRYFVSRVLQEDKSPFVYVFGPEVDYYWPRFKVNSGFEAKVHGIHFIGDCAGYWRGILQAFCSGRECGEHLKRDSYVP